jgi:hypothetical protein
MENYVPSRTCACTRCKWNGLMGPALLVTLGLLLLLDNLHVSGFHRTWPAILIVIGVVKVLQSSSPTAGHPSAAAPLPAEPAPGGGTDLAEVAHE